ncbi:hypothetical protein HanPI659440_Chr09g0323931 [Helianthus annuus]|nr:hypothetical protein HanPI659440_Chr09g0323931 [Helianthus annuus]
MVIEDLKSFTFVMNKYTCALRYRTEVSGTAISFEFFGGCFTFREGQEAFC